MASPQPDYPSSPNFRDFGGLATADGRRVRKGTAYRSEAVLAPDRPDAARLHAIGIGLVIDLRRAVERDFAPNDWWRGHGVELLELDVFADLRGNASPWDRVKDDPTPQSARALMMGSYELFPMVSGPALAVMFERLATTDNPFLIHCTAGKDRTGFMAAMLLQALGVERAEIDRDYMLSDGRFTPAVVEATQKLADVKCGFRVSMETIDVLVRVHPSYLARSFAVIEERYGSVDAFLEKEGGLSDTLRDTLRARLLA